MHFNQQSSRRNYVTRTKHLWMSVPYTKGAHPGNTWAKGHSLSTRTTSCPSEKPIFFLVCEKSLRLISTCYYNTCLETLLGRPSLFILVFKGKVTEAKSHARHKKPKSAEHSNTDVDWTLGEQSPVGETFLNNRMTLETWFCVLANGDTRAQTGAPGR